ncbi:MAG: PIN domain-containing protein [Archaeoglobus sp.]|uniref:PIN domain-containing protein n=1 Tax=Archaeoglobus sp. TaxID=1872626 RepID=UPI001DD46103|nr:PIN domain-containing protein [Archaeoglobus sp.]MBO8179427.1 PIN domain-containing protein [Archaeoglobus sp.]
MGIFFDTNFIVNLIVETDFTGKARAIVEKYIEEEFITSVTVVEETLFVLKRLTKETNSKIVEMVKTVIEGLDIVVVDKLPLSEFLDVFGSYDLLPNDALIAATCKYHGIKRIATFDEDFKRVDFLEVVEA